MKKNLSDNINIYDIAVEANVSTATVSRVLNGKREVSEKTRRKVQQLIAEKGFSPRICANFANNIAVIYRNSNTRVFDSHYTRNILKGIDRELEGKGYLLTIFSYALIPQTLEEFTVFCRQQRIAGCIFLDPQKRDSFISHISGIVPFVVINSRFPGEKIFCINSMDFSGATQAVTYLIQNGHTKIAIVMGREDVDLHIERKLAYETVLQSHDLPVRNDYVVRIGTDASQDIKRVWEYWKTNEILPTAIFAVDDEIALKTMQTFQQLGAQLPQDISIIGFDDYDYDRLMIPHLTTIRRQLYEQGEKAVSLILNSLKDTFEWNENNCNFVFDTELVVRDSVKNIRKQ